MRWSLIVVLCWSSSAMAQDVSVVSTRPGTATVATPWDVVVVLPGGLKATTIAVNDAKLALPVQAPMADFVLVSIPAAQRQMAAADYRITVIAEAGGVLKTATVTIKLDATGLPVKPMLTTGGLFGGATKSPADVQRAAATEIGGDAAITAGKIGDMVLTTATGWTVKGLPRRGVARRDIDPIETSTRLEQVFGEFAWRAYQESHAGKSDVAKLEADLRQAVRDRVYKSGPYTQEEWQPYLEAVEASTRRLADKLDLTNGLHVALVLAATADGFGKLRAFHESFDAYFAGAAVGTGGASGTAYTRVGTTGGSSYRSDSECDDCRRKRRRATCLKLLLLGL